MQFVNIGFGNMVSADRIIAVVSPESAPVKRLVQDAKEAGRLIDASCGRKTNSVIICDSNHVILSALLSDIIYDRINNVHNAERQANSNESEH